MADFVGLSLDLFTLAIKAYEVLQQAIEFPESYSALVLKLDVELTRLQLWGKHSGITQGSLIPELIPLESLIDRVLKRLADLLQDTAKLKEKYGLQPVDEVASGGQGTGSHPKPIMQVRNILRAITELKPRKDTRNSNDDSGGGQVRTPDRLDRLRWAISSREKFDELVEEIRSYVNSLNELLQASQRATLRHDWERTEIKLVCAVDDPSDLLLVRQMADKNTVCQDMVTMASRKAIVANHANLAPTTDHGPIHVLQKEDFQLPSEYHSMTRCIVMYTPKTSLLPITLNNSYFLAEKKCFDVHISSEDKVALLTRLHRLMTLLHTSADSDRGMLPACIGYWSEDNSWCLVYRIPFLPSSTVPPQVEGSLTTAQPLSLLHLLQSSTFRPALERRLNLACGLAAVLSRLYGGQWLHKGIRSENIVFPWSSPSPFYDISRPVIVGFEYSRQYTEPASIDFVVQDFSQAISRHPDYQGDAVNRSGYRLSYDIYSFGLLLAEIAWWVPLEKIYQDVTRKKTASSSSKASVVEYDAPQARAFMEEIVRKVGKEMSFRVGTVYQKVIEWCLKQGRLAFVDDKELVVDFYSNVVVPLETISRIA
ncbi:hypothetical protein V5O48_006976 [Marasmius crinis-equi]|uniref:Prion-inhibition and propagation HeLo domain-containing protein n=1 Tax=Marasmius crinis-equi TaxID=585013 RepID=A0ABR3FIF0_9AGAR